jgi:hypothetical protein
MKKLILAAILTIGIGTVLSAQTKNTNPPPGTNKNSPAYVDKNNNGVCDNYENNTRPYAGKAQGQGRRGGCGMGNRQGCGNMQCQRGGNGRGRT